MLAIYLSTILDRAGAQYFTVIRSKEHSSTELRKFTGGDKLYSGEGNRCSTVFRRREQVHYCSQEKETGALLFS